MEFQPKLTKLAADLRENRKKLLEEWLGTLRIGMEKPGVGLTDDELRNHFADLLEDLCNQLEVPLTEASEMSALKHAESHGDTRWFQGYNLTELIREIASLRTVIVAAVVAHGHIAFSLREQSLANIIVHRFFDALVLESVTFFVNQSQDAILHERQRLAQELHDNACQTLQGALMELAVIRKKLDPSIADQLASVITALNQGVTEVRTITHGLVTGASGFEHGLSAALEEFGTKVSRVVPCAVRCDPSLKVPTKQSIQLFRIAQEAAGNACKHARPKCISITLTERDATFELRVRDDGSGFDPTGQTSGIGLYNMQQRARAIGALLKVESKPGVGTTITCIFPNAAVL